MREHAALQLRASRKIDPVTLTSGNTGKAEFG
jgi:hypothetical protein